MSKMKKNASHLTSNVNCSGRSDKYSSNGTLLAAKVECSSAHNLFSHIFAGA